MSQPMSKDAVPPPVYGAEGDLTHSSGNSWMLALGSIGVVFGDIGTSPLYALQTALGQFEGRRARARRSHRRRLADHLGADDRRHREIRAVPDAGRQQGRGRHPVADGAGAARARAARRRGRFCLASPARRCSPATRSSRRRFRCSRRSKGLKQRRRQRSRPTSCRRPRHPGAAVRRAEPRHGPASRRCSARSWWCSSPSTRCSALVHIATRLEHSAALSAAIPGVLFMPSHGSLGFIVLGSVFLAVTGAEALYADMGHFGRRPIQAAWLFFVLPALICNYLGQGALILVDPKAVDEPLLLLAPGWGLAAARPSVDRRDRDRQPGGHHRRLFAGQQAIQLGLLPRLEIVHTSETQEGQIYMPRVNRMLLVGVLVLVLLFRLVRRARQRLRHRRHRHDGGDDRPRLLRGLEAVEVAALGGAGADRARFLADRHRFLRRQSLQGRRRRLGAARCSAARCSS